MTTKEARVRSKAIKNNLGVVEQCFAAMKNTFIPPRGRPLHLLAGVWSRARLRC
jgi:hypothetical protein